MCQDYKSDKNCAKIIKWKQQGWREDASDL
jgi:hypothetical protein